MKIIASITDCSSNDGRPAFYLKPYRLEVPGFLPESREVAKDMANGLTGYEIMVDDVWILEEGQSWPASEIHRILSSNLDWDSVETIRYDWDAKDQWGDPAHNPWYLWNRLADHSVRAKDLEPFIANHQNAERYAKGLAKSEWASWTEEELARNPCWLFYYARHVCKGRLPEVLDNMMTMKSFEDSENQWVKRYFATKRYRVRNRKALASIPEAAA